MQVSTERTLCVLVTALFLTGCGGGGGGGALASAGTTTTSSLPVSAATPGASSLTQANGLQNGVEWPATFTPYAATSVWNAPVSANPTLASYSAAVVAHQFPSGQNDQAFRTNEAGIYDYSHPVFYASASDPVVNVVCNQYCDAVDNGGVPAQIHVPAAARPAGGGDHHLDVVQPDGTEISMWDVQGVAYPGSNWTSGSTLTAGAVVDCGNFTGGTGLAVHGPGSTAGGACDAAGLVQANELLAGHINHALFVVAECAVGAQYPAFAGATTAQCSSGVGPPLGGRMWYDVPDATTDANPNLQPWEKAVLDALHDYGAYLEDDDGGGAYATGILPETESKEPMVDFGQPDPFAALAAQGWTAISIPNADGHGNARQRWIGANPWQPAGVDLPDHIHWLAPCSAQGTC